MALEPKSAGGSSPLMMSPDMFGDLLERLGRLHEAHVDRIVAALQHRRPLTDEQQATSDAIKAVGRRMGIKGFATPPAALLRRGSVLDVTPPAGTEGVRVYHARGVEEFRIGAGTPIQLPASITAQDRVVRLEFLGPRRRVLGVMGAEPVSAVGVATSNAKGSE